MYFPRGIELKRCGNDTCNYGAACVDRDDGGNPRCACPRDDSDCPADSRTGSTVCGSDGQTYRSECELLRHSCRFKVHLLITSYTPCRGTSVCCGLGACGWTRHQYRVVYLVGHNLLLTFK